jgi:hypothetical protein
VDADIFPTLPLIEELVLDVADLSEVKAEWFVQVLRGIKDVSNSEEYICLILRDHRYS